MTSTLKISDCMKKNVISISPNAHIGEAAAMFAKHHIGSLPVVDDAGHLVGLLQLRDLLAFVLPDFIRLVEDFDFVGDFGAIQIETRSGFSGDPCQQGDAAPHKRRRKLRIVACFFGAQTGKYP